MEDESTHRWMNLPVSAKEARRVRSTKYFTGKPCPKGHVAPRSTRLGACTGCLRRNSWLRNYAAQMPSWADIEAIDAIYQNAAWRTAAEGVQYEVDHIIPLNGKSVCGLHLETNLQIITRKANHDKGNCWDGA